MNPVVVRDRIDRRLRTTTPQPSPRPKPSARASKVLHRPSGAMKPTFDIATVQFRRDHQRDAAGDDDVGFAEPQALTCEVDGGERRRTGAVDRDARTAQVEQIRQSVGDDAVQRSGQRAGIDAVRIAVLELGVIVVIARDKDGGAGAAQSANAEDPRRRSLRSPPRA